MTSMPPSILLSKIFFYIRIVKYCVKDWIKRWPNKNSQLSKCRRLSEQNSFFFFKQTIFTGTSVQSYTCASFSLLNLPFSAQAVYYQYLHQKPFCLLCWGCSQEQADTQRKQDSFQLKPFEPDFITFANLHQNNVENLQVPPPFVSLVFSGVWKRRRFRVHLY